MTTLELMTANARRQTAIVADGIAWTEADLDDRAERTAAMFGQLGIARGDRVAIALGNSAEFAIVFLALMKLRASAVFINPRCSIGEIRESLCRTSTTALVCAASSKDIRAAVAGMDGDIVLDPERLGLLALCRTGYPGGTAGADELMIQFTSGAAGRPKAVARTYDNLAYELDTFASRLPAGGHAVTICPCPLSHSYGLLNGLLMPLFTATPTVLLDGMFLPGVVVEAVQRYRASILVGVPAMYRAIADTHAAQSAELASLRFCFSAGAFLPDGVSQTFQSRYRKQIQQQYGSTETGIVTLNLLDGARPDPLSVGRPLAGREVSVVREDGSMVGPGEPGEVTVRSRTSATSYVNDATSAPLHFRQGFYFTGDIGVADADGELTLVGRRSYVINVGGFKVDPVEVERVLMTFDAVAECVVVPVTRHNVESTRAVVVLKRPVSEREIRQFCRARLVPYKVPRHVTIVNSLPRSLSGKILRKELVD